MLVAVGASTLLVVLVAGFGTLSVSWAEAYVALIYPPVTRRLAPFVEVASWSWTVAALLIAAAVVTYLMASRAGWGRAAVAALIATMLWVSFAAVWGVHYQRAPLVDRLGLVERATERNVGDLSAYLRAVVLANDPYRDDVLPEAPTGAPLDSARAAGTPAGSDRVDRAIASIARSVERLAAEIDGRDIDVPDRVKMLANGVLLAFGTSGMISPWLLEAHVDGGLPPAARVAVAAHELAHLAGFAPEDEAEAVGAIAGLRADDAYARYAVALFQIASVAATFDPDARADLLQALPVAARADLDETRRANERYRIEWLRTLSWSIYDQYLRNQGVADGVASYRGSTSLLAEIFGSGSVAFPPVPDF